MRGEVTTVGIAAVQSKNARDALLEQLYLKLWRFHPASVAVILYFWAVLGKIIHEGVKVEGTGSLHISYFSLSKLFIYHGLSGKKQ